MPPLFHPFHDEESTERRDECVEKVHFGAAVDVC